MIITISGTAASGKSSVAKELAKKLNFKHYSMGDLQREIAKEKGVTILELGNLEAKDDSIDRMIDDRQIQIGKEENNIVVDSWLAANFIPDAIKIFITADPLVRAKRRLFHKRKEEVFYDVESASEDILRREEVNRERWIRYYDFDYKDMDNYDLVVDTGGIPIEKVVEKIIDFVKEREEKK